MISEIKQILFLIIGLTNFGFSQEIIELPNQNFGEDIHWQHSERQYYSNTWKTEVVTNVSIPSLIVHQPDPTNINGTAVIICPGGGLYAHSINSEGHDVADWLAERGVTAFVLKYRLVPTGIDATQEINTDGPNVIKRAGQVLPLSVEDGINAIKYVRSNADKYGVIPDRIGIMGFSAGGAVTMGVTYNYDIESRPDFIAPVYAWMDVVPKTKMPSDAPPIFVACASDDPLRLAPASTALYEEWLAGGKQAELHMYAKGGHGFGMRKQGLPSDQWIEHFGEWLTGQGWME